MFFSVTHIFCSLHFHCYPCFQCDFQCHILIISRFVVIKEWQPTISKLQMEEFGSISKGNTMGILSCHQPQLWAFTSYCSLCFSFFVAEWPIYKSNDMSLQGVHSRNVNIVIENVFDWNVNENKSKSLIWVPQG